MRILIENSGYHLQNMGDVAMLQVAAARIRESCPDAELLTMTIAPDRLAKYVGGHPLDARHRIRWQGSRSLPIPLRRSWLSKSLSTGLENVENRFQIRYPRLAAAAIRMMGGSDPESNGQSDRFIEDLESCDLVVVTGGGFLTDSFLGHANDVLTTLELAHNLDKPTLVFGQGIGPLSCRKTLRRVGRILSQVPLIGIREEAAGRPILKQCGVDDYKIVCTGDDAIELAYARRSAGLSDALGVNLRMSDYSAINRHQLQMLQREITGFVETNSIPSLIAPISYYGPEQDSERVFEIMSGVQGFDTTVAADEPTAIIDMIAKCRLVVTGSYHAGVFALAQGIPVVAIVSSGYYQSKFAGLADQFGIGCQIIDLSRADSHQQLRSALETSYRQASEWRSEILRAAERQIIASRNFYQMALATI